MTRMTFALIAALVFGSISTAFAAPMALPILPSQGNCSTGNTACSAPGP